MKYKIVHDMPGRLRIRCGPYAFSLEQSYSIDHVLRKNNYIKEVKTSHTTGSILIYYNKEYKEKILNLVSKLELAQLPIVDKVDGTKEI